MKRFVRDLAFALIGGGIVFLGVFLAHPGLPPGWARIDYRKLRDWVRADEPKDEDQDDKEKPPVDSLEPKGSPSPVIRLESADWARRIGIETAPAVKERHDRGLICNAETAFDTRFTAEVFSRVSGVVNDVRVDLGQVVRKGDIIAAVDSTQVGAAKVQYLIARSTLDLAQATHDRTVKLTQASAAPAKTELETHAALNQAQALGLDAEQKLRNLGFNDADLDRIAKTNDTGNLLEIVAPIGGTIIAWDATIGEAVEPTTQLFGIADTSKMWLWLDVHEQDIDSVVAGRPLTFELSNASPNSAVFVGKVMWVGAAVNPLTRTARVRADLLNVDARLRANQFGQARVRIQAERDAIVVPRQAVQEDGGTSMVFVPLSDSTFELRRVETAPTDRDDRVEIVRGLKPGERVVTTRAYILKSEYFKDRLGAADND